MTLNKTKLTLLLSVFVFLFTLIRPPAWAKDWDPRLLQSSKMAYQGNWREALSLIDQYIAENPKDPNGLFVKAVVLEWKMQLNGEKEDEAQQKILEVYQEANDMAFQLWNRDQDNIDRLIDLGNSYLFLGRKYSDVNEKLKAVLTGKKCQKHLEKAQKMDPSRVDGLLALGGFHYLADNAPQWLSPFKSFFGIHGTKAQGMDELKRSLTIQHPFYYDTQFAILYMDFELEKNYPEALNALAVMEKEFPENPELKMKRARIYERQDKAKGAEEYLKVAHWCESQKESCPKNYLFLGYYDAGRVNKDLGNTAKAKVNFAKALQNDTLIYPRLTAEALYWPGLIEKAEGKNNEAIEKFKKAQQVPGIPDFLKKQIGVSLAELCQQNSSSCS